MSYEPDDLRRLAFEVRNFLDKGDWRRRILGAAKLYLEMPDIGAMHGLRVEILRALGPEMRACDCGPHYVDEETMAIDVGGISIIITCKQRFMTRAGKAVGYQSMRFMETPLPRNLSEYSNKRGSKEELNRQVDMIVNQLKNVPMTHEELPRFLMIYVEDMSIQRGAITTAERELEKIHGWKRA